MMTFKPSRTTAAFALATLAIVLAGGVAVASNMGFKMNMALVVTSGGAPPATGANWVSIPYNNPYGTAGGFCTQTGLPSVFPNQAQITVVNPNTNGPTSANCGTPAANSLAIGGNCLAFRIQGATVPASIIVVGSHNPTQTCTVPAFTATTGEYWLSVPYHTTAVTIADLCAQGGLSSTFPNQAVLTTINPTNNSVTNASCGTPAAGAANLVLGRAVRIHEKAQKIFTPAHF